MSAGKKSVAPVAGAGMKASNVERLPLGTYAVTVVFVSRAPDGFVVMTADIDVTEKYGAVAKKTLTGWVITDGERAAADETPLAAVRAWHEAYGFTGYAHMVPEGVFLAPIDAKSKDNDVAKSVYRVVEERGVVTVAELEERFGPVRDMVARLWAEGRIDILGDPAGPLPGYVRLRRDGKKYYMLLLRGDDIVVHPRAKARVI